MVDNIKIYGRLIKAYAKLDIAWFFRDLRQCIMLLVTDAAITASSVAGMMLLADRIEGFAGITKPELLFMLSYVVLVNGIYSLQFANGNAGSISRVIGRGQLDHALVQPVPLIIHFMTNGIAPASGSGPILFGIGFFVYALSQQPAGGPINGFVILLMVGLLLVSTLVLTACVYGVSAIAFRAPYAAEEISVEVVDVFNSIGTYPLAGFAVFVQFTLCSVLPIGFMGYLPAAILLGKLPRGQGIAFMLAVASVFVFIMLLVFRKGLNYYEKNSSPRYTGFGR